MAYDTREVWKRRCATVRERIPEMREFGFPEDELKLHERIYSTHFSYGEIMEEMSMEQFSELYNRYIERYEEFTDHHGVKTRMKHTIDGLHIIGGASMFRTDRLVYPDERFWKEEKKRLKSIGLNKAQIRIMMLYGTDDLNLGMTRPWIRCDMSKKRFRKEWEDAVKKIRKHGYGHVGTLPVICFESLMDGASLPTNSRINPVLT